MRILRESQDVLVVLVRKICRSLGDNEDGQCL